MKTLKEYYQWLLNEENSISSVVSHKELEKHFNAFHLSDDLLSSSSFLFTPRVPRYPLDDKRQNGWEDDFTPRISLAPSITKAIDAGAEGPYVYAGYVKNKTELAPRVDSCPGGAQNIGPGGDAFTLGKYLSGIQDQMTPEEIGRILDASRPPTDELLTIRKVPLSVLPSRIKQQFYLCVPDAKRTGEFVSLEPVTLLFLGTNTNQGVHLTPDALNYIKRL